MEATESGATALAMILAYYGRIVPLAELRRECGVGRDGSKPGYLVRAAGQYGLASQEVHCGPEGLAALALPLIVFWNFKSFVVLEGVKKGKVFLNDPECGPRQVSLAEFDRSFSGLGLTFTPGPGFRKGGQRPSVVASLKGRLLGGRAALAYVVLGGLFLVLPGLVVPTFSKVFVDNILVGRMHDWLYPLLVGMGIAALLRAGLTWLQKVYLLRLETKLALSTSAKFFLHVFHLPVQFFQQRFAGEIGSRVQINDRVAQLLSGELAGNILNAVMIIFYGALMLQYDVGLTLIGVLVVLLNLVALKVVAQKRVNLVARLLQDQGKSLGTAVSGLQMIETIKASASESDFFALWAGYQAKVKTAEQELGVSSHLLASLPPLLSALNNIVILILGAKKIMAGQMSMGDLVAFQSLMASFVGPVNQVVTLGSQLQEMRGNLNRLDDVLENPLDPQFLGAQTPALVEKNGPARLSGRLELRNLFFGYNPLEPPLIENFSLSLRPGARVALVGGSGSGKSTVAKLIAGLYQPWQGEILFDGRPRAVIDRPLLTNSVAMVDQDIFMFEGSVRENLTLWDKAVLDADLIQATKDACIHDDIAQRSHGYESVIAEGCNNYSGGQRQRLEIARALVANPTILVLDEATSALDPTTEKIIDENLRRRGCTCVIVAHRLSTIRDCDEIIVLDQGRVAQRGTHEQMRLAEGPYARLIESE